MSPSLSSRIPCTLKRFQMSKKSHTLINSTMKVTLMPAMSSKEKPGSKMLINIEKDREKGQRSNCPPIKILKKIKSTGGTMDLWSPRVREKTFCQSCQVSERYLCLQTCHRLLLNQIEWGHRQLKMITFLDWKFQIPMSRSSIITRCRVREMAKFRQLLGKERWVTKKLLRQLEISNVESKAVSKGIFKWSVAIQSNTFWT